MWCGETLSLLYWLRRNQGKPSCLKIGVSFSRFHTVYLCFWGNYYFFYNFSSMRRTSLGILGCVSYFYLYFCKIMYIWRLKNIFFAHFKTNSNSAFFCCCSCFTRFQVTYVYFLDFSWQGETGTKRSKSNFLEVAGRLWTLQKNINSWYSRVMNLSQSTLSDL